MVYVNEKQAFRGLVSAVIQQAIDDLQCFGFEAYRAYRFILPDSYCECLCAYLDLPIDQVRKKAAALYKN